MVETVLFAACVLLSLALTVQGSLMLYSMLYTRLWHARLTTVHTPQASVPPSLRFTVILPARHEQAVIAQTIRRVWHAHYPKDLLEVVVVCDHEDNETIAAAERVVREIGHPNLQVLTISDGPTTKPHGLNVALRHTTHEVVAIFDAEDDVHPDMFQRVNTIMQDTGAPVIQAGVQLMDFQSNWYAVHNVLEYFFWFTSRVHFHVHVGVVPLIGTSIFLQRQLIETVGGWDEHCLGEDADLGVRVSTRGTPMMVTYDARYATREETPPTIASFIKQRTRWNQGALQVLRKGDWRRFPRGWQQLLAA